VRGERPDHPFALLDGAERQPAGQLLVAPAGEHRGKDLLLRMQQRDAARQLPGLRVPVLVRVDLDTLRTHDTGDRSAGVEGMALLTDDAACTATSPARCTVRSCTGPTGRGWLARTMAVRLYDRLGI
jgi:hypothetical protein